MCFSRWPDSSKALIIIISMIVVDSAAAQNWRFNVPSQSAATGIAAFSRQATTVQLLVAQDALRGRRTNRLRGAYSIEVALTTLLRGSGLRWRRTGPTTYSLLPVASKDIVQ